jgi:alginate O-acetyltransferase complex protein AlgI
MLFNSIHYLAFLPVVVVAFYLISSRYRWALLLLASYYFYMCWKAEFILLIIITTLVNYLSAILMARQKEKKDRRKYLGISLISGLGMLFFYKYFIFFSDTIHDLLQSINIFYSKPVLSVIVPMGISFYTFQTLGYILDVYHGRREPERHLGIFAVYVSFFPLVFSGPIERSTHLLPQLQREKRARFTYEDISQGIKLIIWGFFLKLAVADRAAIYVDAVFNNVDQHSGLSFIAATVFYSFQIYGDFAGYSSIAIGSARLMGFDILKNFNQPYLSTSIKEFWRRWHISLSKWLRDYVFFPIAFSFSRKLKEDKYCSVRADRIIYCISIFITFFLCGLWHGARFTFVIWGCLHGFYLVIENIFKIKPKKRIINIGKTYLMILFTWIFFRADTVAHSLIIIKKILTSPGRLFIPGGPDVVAPIYAALVIFLLVIIEFKREFLPSAPSFFNNKREFVRILAYAMLVALIISVGVFNGGQFIYFQF